MNYFFLSMWEFYLLNWLGSSFIIDILSVIIILCSIGVIISHNAVVSVVYLLSVYILICIYLYFIGLGIIGLLYLMVYVGAIAVLFLFILSLLDLGESELKRSSFTPDVLAILFTLILFVNIYISSNTFNILSSDNIGFIVLLLISSLSFINVFFNPNFLINLDINNLINNTSDYLINTSQFNNLSSNFSNSFININNWYNISSVTEFKLIGELLYTDYASLFIILGFTLVLAVIGAIVLLHQLDDSSTAS